MAHTTFNPPEALEYYLQTRVRENSRLARYIHKAELERGNFLGWRDTYINRFFDIFPDRKRLVDFLLEHHKEGTIALTHEQERILNSDLHALLAWQEQASLYRDNPNMW